MLGDLIEDPDHTESNRDSIPGLGLLRTQTRFVSEKATFQAESEVRGGPGWLADLSGMKVSGYEIHMGRTTAESAWLLINKRNDSPVNILDGGASPDGKIWGCYMHGLFANDDFRRAWLTGIGWQKENPVSQENALQASLDLLADTVEKSIDMALLERIIWN
jgi:adenosylcobyric acid synthase